MVGSRAALRQRVAEARVYSFRLVELEDEDFTLLGRRLVRYHPDRTAGGREKQVYTLAWLHFTEEAHSINGLKSREFRFSLRLAIASCVMREWLYPLRWCVQYAGCVCRCLCEPPIFSHSD